MFRGSRSIIGELLFTPHVRELGANAQAVGIYLEEPGVHARQSTQAHRRITRPLPWSFSLHASLFRQLFIVLAFATLAACGPNDDVSEAALPLQQPEAVVHAPQPNGEVRAMSYICEGYEWHCTIQCDWTRQANHDTCFMWAEYEQIDACREEADVNWESCLDMCYQIYC